MESLAGASDCLDPDWLLGAKALLMWRLELAWGMASHSRPMVPQVLLWGYAGMCRGSDLSHRS